MKLKNKTNRKTLVSSFHFRYMSSPIKAYVSIKCAASGIYYFTFTQPLKIMSLITITPETTDAILTNPGMGWTTFYSFNDDEINSTYPRSSIAYFRLYWADLEPEEGKYRWDIIDKIIETGGAQNQTLALRVMVMDGMEWAHQWRERMLDTDTHSFSRNSHAPAWLRAIGCQGADYVSAAWPAGTPPLWEPVYDDPIFLEKHSNLIQAMGERYDGHAGIDHLDIGTVGRWGEWHCAVVPRPSIAARRKIIDFYRTSFPTTPLLIPIGDQKALAYAIEQGTGWRADCLGDWRQDFFNPAWEGGTPSFNHMEDLYLQRLVQAKALKAWKKGMVAFESCWSMDHWYEKGWPAHCIFDYALAFHCSVMNNKSRPIPEEWQGEVARFTRQMGYRFFLKSLTHPETITREETFAMHMIWENLGVAPCYRDYLLTLRFESHSGTHHYEHPLAANPREWLPGRHSFETDIQLPKHLPIGDYSLKIGLRSPQIDRLPITLAMKGEAHAGWHTVSKITIH